MTDGEEIPIRLIGGHAHAWLSLSGTILTYRERALGRETLLDIPLELVQISEKKLFLGGRLIYGLLALPGGPALGALLSWFLSLIAGPLATGTWLAFLGVGFVTAWASSW